MSSKKMVTEGTPVFAAVAARSSNLLIFNTSSEFFINHSVSLKKVVFLFLNAAEEENDNMRPGPTPERVLAVCRLISQGSYTNQDIYKECALNEDVLLAASKILLLLLALSDRIMTNPFLIIHAILDATAINSL